MSVYHVSTIWHHFVRTTYLRYVQVCHVVKLLLSNRILSQLFVLVDVWCHNCMLIIVVVLVANTYFLVVVTISGLTLLISNKRHTVDAWNTALSVYYLLVLLLVDVKISARVQVEFFFRIECIEILEIRRIKSVLETLFECANDVEVLLIFANLLRPMLTFLLCILLVIKVHDL
jgi:hypothetical protein